MKKLFNILFIFIVFFLTACGSFDESSPRFENWLCTINTDGTGLTYLMEDVSHDGSAQFTPDGESIVLAQSDGGYHDNFGFVILNAQNGNIESEMNTSFISHEFSISSNGIIGFGSRDQATNSSDIFLYSIENGETSNLTSTESRISSAERRRTRM